ncbi:MAG: PQQ-binding-like beta-propeller repeat protein [Planctomycetota bacterium]|jgi:hypothetical protein
MDTTVNPTVRGPLRRSLSSAIALVLLLLPALSCNERSNPPPATAALVRDGFEEWIVSRVVPLATTAGATSAEWPQLGDSWVVGRRQFISQNGSSLSQSALQTRYKVLEWNENRVGRSMGVLDVGGWETDSRYSRVTALVDFECDDGVHGSIEVREQDRDGTVLHGVFEVDLIRRHRFVEVPLSGVWMIQTCSPDFPTGLTIFGNQPDLSPGQHLYLKENAIWELAGVPMAGRALLPPGSEHEPWWYSNEPGYPVAHLEVGWQRASGKPLRVTHHLWAGVADGGEMRLHLCSKWRAHPDWGYKGSWDLTLTRKTDHYGLPGYCQGGIVVDGIAYFTAGERRAPYPNIVAFDVDTFEIVKRYPFDSTYDSSPMIVRDSDGTDLIIAHEDQNQRTVAMDLASGQIAWVSAPNQPGRQFGGYALFKLDERAARSVGVPDRSGDIILASCANGLHALSARTGTSLWHLKPKTIGNYNGVTPCVDQAAGHVFYQADKAIYKIDVITGRVLAQAQVPPPNVSISWNTVFVDDKHGRYVATYWYGAPSKDRYDCAIRVYDTDLNLEWERTELPLDRKTTLCYFDGKLVVTPGHVFSYFNYSGDGWKYIPAYDISTGTLVWKCDLSAYDYPGMLNAVYYNGFVFAETVNYRGYGEPPSFVFKIDGSTGRLVEVFGRGDWVTSCAPCIIAHGKLFSGDINFDRITAVQIAENSKQDWPSVFGTPARNTMALPEESGARLVPMREIKIESPPGGFFRFSRAPAWRQPNSEEVLAANARRLRSYLEAYQLADR